MKSAQFFLKSNLSIFARFEKGDHLAAGLDLSFPAINRFDRRKNVRAGCELFFDQLIGNAARGLRVGKSAEREENFLGHALKRKLTRPSGKAPCSAKPARFGESSRRRGQHRSDKR